MLTSVIRIGNALIVMPANDNNPSGAPRSKPNSPPPVPANLSAARTPRRSYAAKKNGICKSKEIELFNCDNGL